MSSVPGVRYSLDAAEVDFEVVFAFLSGESYWAKGISREKLRRAMDASLCVSAFDGHRQIGFARIISDRVAFAYLCDVFVLEPHRGKGIARAMVRFAMDHPELQGIRRWLLATRDAHGVYAALGFTALADPRRYMERMNERAYESTR